MADVLVFNFLRKDVTLSLRIDGKIRKHVCHPNTNTRIPEEEWKILQKDRFVKGLLDTKRISFSKSASPASDPVNPEELKDKTSNPERPEELKDTANAEAKGGKVKHEVKSVETVELPDDAPKGGKQDDAPKGGKKKG